MEYTKVYITNEERTAFIDEAEANGYTMLHDAFLPEGKTLTFGEPKPPTEEELYQKQLEEEFNLGHEDLVLLIDRWGTLTNAQKLTASNLFIPYVAKWMLWKDGYLELGVLD